MKCISFSLMRKPGTSDTAAVHCALLQMHQEVVMFSSCTTCGGLPYQAEALHLICELMHEHSSSKEAGQQQADAPGGDTHSSCTTCGGLLYQAEADVFDMS